MKAQWFKNCKKPEDKEQRKKEVLTYTQAFEELREIIEHEFSSKPPSKTNYDCPAWSHKQAHLNGETDAVQKILGIIDLKE